MDYEKLYKEAFERARKFKSPYCQAAVEQIFPELAESEDEKIRKELLAHIQQERASSTLKVNHAKWDRMITWLKKQGEQPKKVSIWKHWKDGIAGNGIDKPIYLIKDCHTYSLSPCLSSECDYIELSELDNLMLEKQGEKKPADNYCQENCKGFQETGKCFVDGECKAKRDAEQNPAWSEEDENLLSRCVCDFDYLIKNENRGFEERYKEQIDWLKSIKDRVQPKQEWSEEDEHRRTDAIYFLESAEKHYADTSEIEKTIDWLKSLKDKIHWKPTEEQIHCFKCVIDFYKTKVNDTIVLNLLNSLYNDLKKL